MITDSLSNGIKELFAALGAKTSDSNYAVPLLNKTNGTPQGMMDMSSLASVLGGILNKIKGVKWFDQSTPGTTGTSFDISSSVPNYSGILICAAVGTGNVSVINMDSRETISGSAVTFNDNTSTVGVLSVTGDRLYLTKKYDWANEFYFVWISPRYAL